MWIGFKSSIQFDFALKFPESVYCCDTELIFSLNNYTGTCLNYPLSKNIVHFIFQYIFMNKKSNNLYDSKTKMILGAIR